MDGRRRREIELEAHRLHALIWRAIPEEERPESVEGRIDLLMPEIAAYHLGLEVWKMDILPGGRGTGYEAAGVLDRKSRLIALSEKFPAATVRFTFAHEIGHWLLHPNEVSHRDMPIDGGSPRAPMPEIELEANYFAACFLMPRRLLIQAFERCFGPAPLKINDTTAFWIAGRDAPAFMSAQPGSMRRELDVAKATSFNGKLFDSLVSQFKVSNKAMAYRLQELELVPDWP